MGAVHFADRPVVPRLGAESPAAAHAKRIDDVGVVCRRLHGVAAARTGADGVCGGGERDCTVDAERPQGQPVLPDPLQYRGDRSDDSVRRPGLRMERRRRRQPGLAANRHAAACRRDRLLPRKYHVGFGRRRPDLRSAAATRLERQLSLVCPQLFRRRDRLDGRRHDRRRRQSVAPPNPHSARLPDVPQLQGVSGPSRGRATAYEGSHQAA